MELNPDQQLPVIDSQPPIDEAQQSFLGRIGNTLSNVYETARRNAKTLLAIGASTLALSGAELALAAEPVGAAENQPSLTSSPDLAATTSDSAPNLKIWFTPIANNPLYDLNINVETDNIPPQDEATYPFPADYIDYDIFLTRSPCYVTFCGGHTAFETYQNSKQPYTTQQFSYKEAGLKPGQTDQVDARVWVINPQTHTADLNSPPLAETKTTLTEPWGDIPRIELSKKHPSVGKRAVIRVDTPGDAPTPERLDMKLYQGGKLKANIHKTGKIKYAFKPKKAGRDLIVAENVSKGNTENTQKFRVKR